MDDHPRASGTELGLQATSLVSSPLLCTFDRPGLLPVAAAPMSIPPHLKAIVDHVPLPRGRSTAVVHRRRRLVFTSTLA